MTTIRRWHAYFGLFMGPSILFFALTGAAQLYNLHEAHGEYQPPAILEKLSSVHKDQVFAIREHHEPQEPNSDSQKPGGDKASSAATATATATATEDEDKPKQSTLALKGFFLLVALCLVLSTCLGLWMGLTQTRQKRLAWMLVLAGTLIPAGLLVL